MFFSLFWHRWKFDKFKMTRDDHRLKRTVNGIEQIWIRILISEFPLWVLFDVWHIFFKLILLSFPCPPTRYTLYVRLFIVMGITWTMEVISFFVTTKHFFFLITDFINTIQGVIVFIILILTPANLKLIRKRWPNRSYLCWWAFIDNINFVCC